MFSANIARLLSKSRLISDRYYQQASRSAVHEQGALGKTIPLSIPVLPKMMSDCCTETNCLTLVQISEFSTAVTLSEIRPIPVNNGLRSSYNPQMAGLHGRFPIVLKRFF